MIAIPGLRNDIGCEAVKNILFLLPKNSRNACFHFVAFRGNEFNTCREIGKLDKGIGRYQGTHRKKKEETGGRLSKAARSAQYAADRESEAIVVSSITPNKNGSAVELVESKTYDAAILDDPVKVVTGTVAWRPERAETAFTVHIPLPMRALFVLDVGGATTGFEGLSGTVVIGKTSGCQGGCDILCPHRIAVSYSEVL